MRVTASARYGEVGKLAEEVRAGRKSSMKAAAVGLAAFGLVGSVCGLTAARRRNKAAKIQAKKRVAV